MSMPQSRIYGNTLGIARSDNVEAIEAEMLSGAAIAPSEWSAIAEILARGSKSDCEHAESFGSLATLSGPERLETYLGIFCTSTLAPRKSIATRAITDTVLVERLAEEQRRLCALIERRRAVQCRDRSAAILTVTYNVMTRDADDKQRRGLFDYDEHVDKTLGLLTRTDAAWVHYKLDFGIDHVLVDEVRIPAASSGTSAPDHRRNHCRAGARERTSARSLGRRRKTVDLFVSGRRAKGIRGYGALFQDGA